jgi:hypothetical protein
LSAEKVTSAWTEGFKANLSALEFEALGERLARFNSLFPAMKKGDVLHLDYLPGTGTEVRINGELMGTIKGGDFYRALLMVWLGDKPADKGLKKAMLGG